MLQHWSEQPGNPCCHDAHLSFSDCMSKREKNMLFLQTERLEFCLSAANKMLENLQDNM